MCTLKNPQILHTFSIITLTNVHVFTCFSNFNRKYVLYSPNSPSLNSVMKGAEQKFRNLANNYNNQYECTKILEYATNIHNVLQLLFLHIFN